MRLHHLALRARDPAATAAFYRDHFALPERRRDALADGTLRAVWLAADGVVLMVERAAPGEPLPAAGGMDLVAFAIPPEAREPFRARLAAAGVAVEAETEYTLYFRDPDGRRVGVSSYSFGG